MSEDKKMEAPKTEKFEEVERVGDYFAKQAFGTFELANRGTAPDLIVFYSASMTWKVLFLIFYFPFFLISLV